MPSTKHKEVGDVDLPLDLAVDELKILIRRGHMKRFKDPDTSEVYFEFSEQFTEYLKDLCEDIVEATEGDK